ncbi:MAG: NmrA family NAD(P)-binding protein [Bryobacteraceae bacterium]
MIFLEAEPWRAASKLGESTILEVRMYVVTGATGHTGSVIAKRLLAQGKKVRVVGRSTERLSSLVSLGAEPFAADISNKESITRAFSGGEAAYVMIPPDLANPDYATYQGKVIEAIASALDKGAPAHVVALSSFGADKPDKTGPIAGLHRMEERLKRISGLNALYLRAGYFMENTLPQAGVIQQMGATGGPLKPDLKIPMIATRDIGIFAADELLRLEFRGHETQELLGQRDLAMTQAAMVIGKAIGKPDLQYRQITYDEFRGVLMQMGASEGIADMFVEMSEALNSGHVRALEARSQRNTTPTSYEQFVAEEFVPAYQATSAGVT